MGRRLKHLVGNEYLPKDVFNKIKFINVYIDSNIYSEERFLITHMTLKKEFKLIMDLNFFRLAKIYHDLLLEQHSKTL